MEIYMNKIVIILMSFSIIFCQPGKARGPGGQYENRMEMMTWGLHLLKKMNLMMIGMIGIKAI